MRFRNLIIFLAFLPLCGCGMFGLFSSDMDLDEVKIHALHNANDNDAIAIDVVLILKERCDSQVSQLSASDWFSERAQILRDHPNCIAVKSWELVPDQSADVDIDEDPVTAYVFARYSSKGDHRIQIANNFDTIHILLKQTDFIIREQEKAE